MPNQFSSLLLHQSKIYSLIIITNSKTGNWQGAQKKTRGFYSLGSLITEKNMSQEALGYAWIWNLALVTIFCGCTVPLTQIGFIFLLILCIMHHVLQVSPKSSPPIRGIKFRWSQRSQLSQRNQRSQRSGAAWVWLSGSELVGGDWNMTFIFPEILGMSSSQLTNSYFSEG